MSQAPNNPHQHADTPAPMRIARRLTPPRHHAARNTVQGTLYSERLMTNQVTDKLDQLIAEHQRTHSSITPRGQQMSTPPKVAAPRVRASALFIPEHLYPMVSNFAGSRHIRLVVGVFEEASRRQTIYTSSAGAARILEAFRGQGVSWS